MYDYLIVGAGFAGSVLAERLASQAGRRVLVIDRRPHLGGTAFDEHDAAGILVNRYGPHIFHTNSREVHEYLSQFTNWLPYVHRVLASVDGKLVPLPITLNTVNMLYGIRLTLDELPGFFAARAERRNPIRTSEDLIVGQIGWELFEKFYRSYTRKHWGIEASQLDASVAARLPIRIDADDRYFTDTYQGMPTDGYTRLFERMLAHPNIDVRLNVEYHEVARSVSYGEMIYTGPIDELFDYRFGRLPYRSVTFRFETLDAPQALPAPVINYPNEHAYTRVSEAKQMTGQVHPRTTLLYEYPCAEGEPFYPVPRPESASMYRRYRDLAVATPNLHVTGRLGTYRYFTIDQVVAQSLALFRRLVRGIKSQPGRPSVH